MIVGTFSPEIEVWNLDSENCEPVFVLGSFDESEKRKKLVKNFKKQPPIKESIPEDTHTDAVMSLSLNQFEREYLLSGSADKTVRVWDLEETQCKAVYSDLHCDKVQAVRWNRVNKQVFASGGYDGHLNLVDVRDPSK
jgi:periodic tryptophan protein 1